MIVTLVPTAPLVGVNDVIVGTGEAVTVKLVPLVAVPSGFVTLNGPVVAPLGTVVVIWLFESAENVAVVPLNLTSVTGLEPLELLPEIVTVVPTGPLVGVNDEMVGAAANAGGTPMSETVNPATAITITALTPRCRA